MDTRSLIYFEARESEHTPCSANQHAARQLFASYLMQKGAEKVAKFVLILLIDFVTIVKDLYTDRQGDTWGIR